MRRPDVVRTGDGWPIGCTYQTGKCAFLLMHKPDTKGETCRFYNLY